MCGKYLNVFVCCYLLNNPKCKTTLEDGNEYVGIVDDFALVGNYLIVNDREVVHFLDRSDGLTEKLALKLPTELKRIDGYRDLIYIEPGGFDGIFVRIDERECCVKDNTILIEKDKHYYGSKIS